jgi:alkylated DNA repair dioxygenase AlkB
MVNEVSLKIEELEKSGYSSIQEWMDNSLNIYTGDKVGNYGPSKWKNPFLSEPNVKKSLQLYVLYLFRSNLIYDIDELNDKNLGCFCHNPRKEWQEPMCSNQVLVDLINRCYKPLEDLIKHKKKEMSKQLITLTFGDAAENHKGMEQIGKKLAPGNGFNRSDLEKMTETMKELNVECNLINLTDALKDLPDVPNKTDACVLVMKGAATILVNQNGKSFNQIDLFNEQTKLAYDKKVFMYGQVRNKHARWNLCFDEKDRPAAYEKGKGTIIGYDKVPIMKELREKFFTLFGEKAADLKVESNYYYDTDKCGIGWHGDSERVKVIAIRLGYSSMPIYFQWFYYGKPVGERIKIDLEPGDIYVMSEKAVGSDWKKRIIPTLRHATGAASFLKIKTIKS